MSNGEILHLTKKPVSQLQRGDTILPLHIDPLTNLQQPSTCKILHTTKTIVGTTQLIHLHTTPTKHTGNYPPNLQVYTYTRRR
jgi:hypothetical protein